MYRMLVKQIQDRGKLSEDVRSGKSSLLYDKNRFSHHPNERRDLQV